MWLKFLSYCLVYIYYDFRNFFILENYLGEDIVSVWFKYIVGFRIKFLNRIFEL